MTKGMPYAASRLTSLIRKRILELGPRKNQVEIAVEAGFVNTNMLSTIVPKMSSMAFSTVSPPDCSTASVGADIQVTLKPDCSLHRRGPLKAQNT